MKSKPGQMVFDFVVEMEFAEAQRREQEDQESKQRNKDDHWQSVKQEHPVTEAEKIWLPAGIRLVRHIHLDECEGCEMGPEDHSEGNKYEQPVCLKDVHQLESERGAKVDCCFAKLSRQPVTREEQAILAQFPDKTYLLADISELAAKCGIPEAELRPKLGLMHIKGLVWQVGADWFHRTR